MLRDPTRGGLATTLNEIAVQSRVGILLDEAAIPVRAPVAAACEMLGFDPLYVANEGKLIVIVAPQDAETAAGRDAEYALWRRGRPDWAGVGERSPGRVMMKTRLGSTRVVDRLSGEMLPGSVEIGGLVTKLRLLRSVH